MTTELLPCPFCGKGKTVVEEDSKHWTGMRYVVLSWRVLHWCEVINTTPVTRGILKINAKTEEEAVAKWNTRHEYTV